MYNLYNLNDYEFEILSKDIMQKKLNVILYRFPKGRDGGIDLCDNILQSNIIIQVKHYKNYSALKTALKNEANKVKKINPNKYYIITSYELTHDNKKEMYELFKDFMLDDSHIIGGIEINDFLEKEENIDIVKRNFKLWLCASNVLSLICNQNIFIDCEDLMQDIEEQIKLFVETQAYHIANKKLYDNNIVIITGNPGVGKSTLSKMLILYWANQGYTVKYSSSNNLSDLKKSISIHPEVREIILLDDFIGQHYLNIQENYPNEIKSLISYIERNKNKKIILNTRITILQEAINKYLNFEKLIQRQNSNIHLIDLNKMPVIEKAKILYNHIYFNKIEKEYFENIRNEQHYLHIINHKNYNPRIIEFATNRKNYISIEPEHYYEYIMQKLNNPQDVWKDEFENRLDVSDRILMHILYSLTDTYIDKGILEKAFNYAIRDLKQIDQSVNVFNKSLNRLSDSLLKQVIKDGKIQISVLNPSINDYIKNELLNNPAEQRRFLKHSLYIEQVNKVIKNLDIKMELEKMLITGEFLEFNVLKDNIYFYILKFILDTDIVNKNIIDIVQLAFEKSYEKIFSSTSMEDYSELINKFIKTYSEVYELKEILLDENRIRWILEKLTLDDLIQVIQFIITKYIERK